jgi:hypothetical protein
MKDKAMYAAFAAALPALVLAAAGWLQADAATKDALAQKEKKLALADNYGEYVEDRMSRDEALERALMNCMALLPARAAVEPAPGMVASPEALEAPAPDLEALAEEFGYEQRVAP